MSDLIIKISAESKDFEKKIDEVKKETEGLDSALGEISKTSAIAFAGLLAGAGLAIHAFGESEQASQSLINTLQNQGIASNQLVEQYKALAAEVQKKTGIDDDSIIKGQAILQNFLGQTQVSKELTFALADLSQKTGSVDAAADILGKGISGNTKVLKAYGIEIDDNLTKQQRLNEIIKQVTQKFGGLAEAENNGIGSIRGLKSSFGDFLENVGERLEPAFVLITKALTGFFDKLNENGPVLDFIVETGKVLGILTLAIGAMTTAGFAIVGIRNAFLVAQAAAQAFGISAKIAAGAAGIGLLAIVVGEIYANWNKIFPALTAVYTSFANNIGNISSGLGDILSGIFVPSAGGLAKVKAGFDKLKGVIAGTFDAIKESQPQPEEDAKPLIESSALQVTAAQDAAAKVARAEQDKQDTIRASRELIKLIDEEASTASLELKKQEIELLKKFEEEKNETQRDLLIKQYDDLEKLQAAQFALDKGKKDEYQKFQLTSQASFLALSQQQQEAFVIKNKQLITDQLQSEDEARSAFALTQQKKRIETHNKQLEDQQKYGIIFAAIDKDVNSDQVEGASKAANALIGLSKSKNATLKSIGKAAAVTAIGIDTARGAIAAYTGFLTAIPFPPVSIPLGIAAAAAVIIYGGERINDVLAAQGGGIVPGFNMGSDSVHSFLQPGEFVVPQKNFNEVVSAVANQRLSSGPEQTAGITTNPGNTSQSMALELMFSGDGAEKFLTARQVESRSLGTLRESVVEV